MKKTLFILSLLVIGATHHLCAQTTTLVGKIQKKTWTKTLQSYCAGGSDYYVLQQKGKAEIVLDLSAWNEKKIAKKINKRVCIKGEFRADTKAANNPMEQHPVGDTNCTKFVVQ